MGITTVGSFLFLCYDHFCHNIMQAVVSSTWLFSTRAYNAMADAYLYFGTAVVGSYPVSCSASIVYTLALWLVCVVPRTTAESSTRCGASRGYILILNHYYGRENKTEHIARPETTLTPNLLPYTLPINSKSSLSAP